MTHDIRKFIGRYCLITMSSGAKYCGPIVAVRGDKLCISNSHKFTRPAAILNKDGSVKVAPKNGLTRWLDALKIDRILVVEE